MINTIIDGICIALNEEFGDDYTIYTENIEQGLKEPCFFVQCINPTNNLFRGNRYRRTNEMCIQYFPSTDDEQTECNAVAERMFDCLEWIDVDGLQMGLNMHSEMVDKVLNFFVDYNFFTKKVKDEQAMEHISHQTGVRG